MNKLEAVEQLEDLKEHCNLYSQGDPWDKDVQALEIAIEALKRVAAPEVPVRELEDKDLHSLKIEDGKVKLDDFNIKCVTGFEIKSSAAGTTELTLKLIVKSSNMLID